MLLNFRVENYRSLRDEQELDLRSAYRDEAPAVPVAALYGANASGKSTVLEALRFMHDAVTDRIDDWKPRGRIPREPFLLDRESRDKPSSFAVELLLDGVRYVYGFTISDERVEREWCYSYPKKVRRIIFDRTAERVRFGGETQSSRSDLLAEITPANILFITTAARSNQEVFQSVYDWFRDKLWFMSPQDDYGSCMTRSLFFNSRHAHGVLELLKAADFGISHVEFKIPEIDVGIEPAQKAVSAKKAGAKKSARKSAREAVPSPALRITSGGGGSIDLTYDGPDEDLPEFIRAVFREGQLRFRHSGKLAGDFSLENESHGTRTWFKMIGISLRALVDGFTLVIDELDTSLHPLLVARYVGLFQNRHTNSGGAQIILSTHDTSLLGRHGGDELLRRDQVWFVEKDHESGSSNLFALTEFRPPAGLNWEKRYLGGAVGAVPFIDDDALVRAIHPDVKRDDDSDVKRDDD